MKNSFVRLARRRSFQPLWERLDHVSRIGMNYWGGASLAESGELAVIRAIARSLGDEAPLTIFDVGANRGEYALVCAEVFGPRATIFSFEPSRRAFEALSHATSGRSHIHPVNAGFGERVEERTLYSSAPGAKIASLYDLKAPLSPFKDAFSENISIDTVTTFCAARGIEDIDLLKVDVEGHELPVLQGATKLIGGGRIRFVQFEFGECHIDSRTFIRDFYELFGEGYRFNRIVSDGLRPMGPYSPEMEVFHTTNYLVERTGSGPNRSLAGNA